MRRGLALAGGLVLGLLLAAPLFLLVEGVLQLQAYRIERQRPEDTVMVMVAARQLQAGVTITEEDLVAIEIPPRFLPPGVFITPELVVGRAPSESILVNEFVREERLGEPAVGTP